jgi:large subunit ribosomal protein L11
MAEIKAMVEGGKASAGAPLGPALGPLGVNIGEVVAKINEKTKSFAGMKVPVTVEIDSKTKSFEIKVGSPPMSALIKKEANIKTAAANPKTEKVADLTIAQIRKIAEMKIDSLNSYKIKPAVIEVIGSCASMGVTIEGKKPTKIIKEIKAGIYDSQLAE